MKREKEYSALILFLFNYCMSRLRAKKKITFRRLELNCPISFFIIYDIGLCYSGSHINELTSRSPTLSCACTDDVMTSRKQRYVMMACALVHR